MPRPLFAAVLLLVALPLAAQPGPYDDSYYGGYFDERPNENDWFYDRYGSPLAEWPDAGDWYYRNELYTGRYDEDVDDDDWFFDRYEVPSAGGPFGVWGRAGR